MDSYFFSEQVYGAVFAEDMCWYRCKVEHQSADKINVFYIDYGNSEAVSRSGLVELPEDLQTAPLAKKYKFWGFHVYSEQDSLHFQQGKAFLHNLIYGKKLRILKKSVCFDGTILVQAFQGSLNIGEEILKMKFATLSVPESPLSPRIKLDPSDPAGLWPLAACERGCWGDTDISRSTGYVPKLRPAFTDHREQEFKEKSPIKTLQPATSLKKKMDNDLLDENEQLRAERDILQQTKATVEHQLSQSQAELQRLREQAKNNCEELKKLREEKKATQQRTDHLEKQLQELQEELQALKKDFQQKVEEKDNSLETAVGDKLSRLAQIVLSVRELRESNHCPSASDSLLESIDEVVSGSISMPGSMERMKKVWAEYDQAQENVRGCGKKEELDQLITSRDEVQGRLLDAAGAFLQEVDGLPISERMEKLEVQKVNASLASYGPLTPGDSAEEAFDELRKWKTDTEEHFLCLRAASDSALEELCSCSLSLMKFFSLSENTSVCVRDMAKGVDELLKQAELKLWNEQEATLSFKVQGGQDTKIVASACQKLMHLIQTEQTVLCEVRENYIISLKFKEANQQWQDGPPKLDGFFSIKKHIRNLHSQLRWKLVEEGCLEEAEEEDLTQIMLKKEEIAETRNALFKEISKEKEEYEKLSSLIKDCYPELPLLYPEVDILGYMRSEGLLVRSLDRDMFEAEPMKELSGRRPLVCTDFKGRKVILKGYSVDDEAEARMLDQATQYHSAQIRSEETPNLLPILALFFGKSDPLGYVIVPYLSHGSLKTIQKTNPLASGEVARVMRGVVLGLEALHTVSVTHGSLHPSNLFVLNREQGILGDYDFTKALELRAVDSQMIVGSISLVAPELHQGSSPTPASDMYAFGCLLLWLNHPEFNGAMHNNKVNLDASLKLEPSLHILLTKLLIDSGRLTASEALTEEYFLSVHAQCEGK
ncbi:serine/threonine-protein kinase 31 [Denticeps clupeoides]|uniref:serine/threonine-protein kinase 31 n=1 Tax=Denticeps clupeoides TaxID=299321 RepID=UPI0010A51EC7|nr:serine/threonine-protein kinase 31 [Denticeps clupeoides]